jgi:hypothetical protein
MFIIKLLTLFLLDPSSDPLEFTRTTGPLVLACVAFNEVVSRLYSVPVAPETTTDTGPASTNFSAG